MKTSDCISDTIEIKRVSILALTPKWDRFAQACKSSYMCSYGFVFGKINRLAAFEIYVQNNKIGQCAIHRTGNKFRFLDKIQLLPDFQFLWLDVVKKILPIIGNGTYVYGSTWNFEPLCVEAASTIPGLTIEINSEYQIQAVDFARWETFEHYKRSMSENARRNSAKALKSDPNMMIRYNHGISGTKDTFGFIKMRNETYGRKGQPFNRHKAAIRYLSRTLLLKKHAYTASIEHKSDVVAFVSCIEFGGSVYYVDGASLPNNGGGAWHLLTDVLKRSYEKYPNGKFVMGADKPDNGLWEGWDNVLRQRQQCRVANFPTSVTTFSYNATETGQHR